MNRETRPTVKDLKDTLEKMRKVYDFEDEKTIFFNNLTGGGGQTLQVATVDEETGVYIEMSKNMTGTAKENQE